MEPTSQLPQNGFGRPLRVLFVCTANRARSVYAERRARSLVSGDVVRFASAGVRARAGESVEPGMAAELRKRGLSASDHLSQPVTRELLESADLVVTFEFAHHMSVLEGWPHVASRVAGFTQLISGIVPSSDSVDDVEGGTLLRLIATSPPDSMSLDVEDPYRRGSRFAAACARKIDEGLEVLIPFLGRVESPVDNAPWPTIDPAGADWDAPVSPRRALPEPVTPSRPRWALLPRNRSVADHPRRSQNSPPTQ